MRKIILATITISLFLNFSLSAKEVPSSGEMISELLVRPLGLAGLAVGSRRRLVLAPALFTFARGVGDYPDHMEEIELVKE